MAAGVWTRLGFIITYDDTCHCTEPTIHYTTQSTIHQSNHHSTSFTEAEAGEGKAGLL